MMKLYLTMMLVIFICSCGQESSREVNHASEPKTPSMLDAQIDALEDAKNVEQSMDEMKQARDQVMREQGI